MVEAPAAAKTASGFGHSPCGQEQGQDLPARAVQVFNMGKSCQSKCKKKSANGENNAADDRFAAQAQDGVGRKHNSSNVARGREEAPASWKGTDLRAGPSRRGLLLPRGTSVSPYSLELVAGNLNRIKLRVRRDLFQRWNRCRPKD